MQQTKFPFKSVRLIVFFLIPILCSLFGCQKELTNDTVVNTSNTELKKKWILPTANPLGYASIEFAPGNTYIIVFSDGTSTAGRYSVAANGTTVTLANLGMLEVSNLTSTTIGFSLQRTGALSAIAAMGAAGNQRVSSTNTNLLCNLWNLYKEYEDSSGTITKIILYPQTYQTAGTGTIKLEVIFSDFGTYFVTEVARNGLGVIDTTYLNRNWNWDNAAETRLRWYDAVDTGFVDVLKLTTTALDVKEDSSFSFLNR